MKRKQRMKRCAICSWSTYPTRAWQARLARHAKTHARPNGLKVYPVQLTPAQDRRAAREAKAQVEASIRAGDDGGTFRAEIQRQLREHIMAEVRRQLEALR
jgi:hypothetical protein